MIRLGWSVSAFSQTASGCYTGLGMIEAYENGLGLSLYTSL
jgi:hypothetical protein